MKNITIIGIGLIGSSIARDIREKNNDVIINIVDSSNTALEKSKKLNLGNNYFEEISTFIGKTEIIFICTPISAYESLFEKFNNCSRGEANQSNQPRSCAFSKLPYCDKIL